MKYSCPNCLEPTDEPGTLCEKCRSVWWTGMDYGFTTYAADYPADDGPDDVYIKMLKQRRVESYARARRMASHGR